MKYQNLMNINRLVPHSSLFALCLLLGLALPGDPLEARSLSLGGAPDDVIEEAIEDNVEESVEEAVEESVEEQVADAAEEAAEEAIIDAIEERTLSLGGAPIEQRIEDRVEEQVEGDVIDSVEDAIEDSVADAINDSVTEDVEDSIEDVVEEAVEEVVENSIEDTLEEDLEQVVETTVEDAVEESVENDVEQEVAQNLEQELESDVETAVEVEVAAAVEEQIESEIDEILDVIESGFEVDEGRIHKDQWLVMAEPEVFEELADKGYLFATVTDLPGLGLRLAEVAAPSSFDIGEVRQGVIDVVGKDRADVDLNHIYTAGTLVDSPENEGTSPRDAIEFPDDLDQMSLRIGMIDSEVDVSHPSLAEARVNSRSFTPKDAKRPDFHGTAIASIIAANGQDFRGIAPGSEVYAASVFQQHEEEGEIASTVSLVRALDWLMTSGVDTINISLAGPPNRLLETALARASTSGVVILAAAGNGGPVAEPMYPAAYDSVVAVTAVDASGKVFRLANRGSYLDLAAPGVALVHARAGGGYSASSGTSFAVPFATTAAARLRQLNPEEDVIQTLFRDAEDVGPPGRDDIYGYGLLRPAS